LANTKYLKTEVEAFVRCELEHRYGRPFSSRFLRLVTGGQHEFDAVSDDGSIVASIKASSGLTSGGRLPSGKFNDNIAELYFLTLVEAQQRFLILTSPEFYALLQRKLKERIAPGLSLLCIPLAEDIQREVDAVVLQASREMRPTVEAVEIESTIT
jgi:hypothetical protein